MAVKKLSLFVQVLAVAMALLCRAQADTEPPLFQIHAVADEKSTEGQIFVLTRKESTESVAVEPAILLDEKDLQSAKAFISPDGEPSILLTLTEAGRERWIDLTTKYTGRQVALFLRGKLISAPSIQRPITGKTIEISGGFTEPEAVEFARKLNARSSK
jgi:preprotein translocase subunit SecD